MMHDVIVPKQIVRREKKTEWPFLHEHSKQLPQVDFDSQKCVLLNLEFTEKFQHIFHSGFYQIKWNISFLIGHWITEV